MSLWHRAKRALRRQEAVSTRWRDPLSRQRVPRVRRRKLVAPPRMAEVTVRAVARLGPTSYAKRMTATRTKSRTAVTPKASAI